MLSRQKLLRQIEHKTLLRTLRWKRELLNCTFRLIIQTREIMWRSGAGGILMHPTVELRWDALPTAVIRSSTHGCEGPYCAVSGLYSILPNFDF